MQTPLITRRVAVATGALTTVSIRNLNGAFVSELGAGPEVNWVQ